jgi:hypothetical protein
VLRNQDAVLMLSLLCSLGLASCAVYVTPVPDDFTIQRQLAPAPFVPSAITVVHYPTQQRVDVVFPPYVSHHFAPNLTDSSN